jgi:hypothetical protein
MNNIHKISENTKSLIVMLVSMICILEWIGITTIIASAAVTPTTSLDEASLHRVSATKVSDALLASCEEKLQKTCESQPNGTSGFTRSNAETTSAAGRAEPNAALDDKTASPENGTKTHEKTTHASIKTAAKPINSSEPVLSTLKSSVNTSLINAFEELEFEIHINSGGDCEGCFSASKHAIEMRSACVGTFRHEMGHFLDTLKNMVSKSSEFSSIYKKEKAFYHGGNVEYVTKNAQEYFAQSYRNYLENKSKLKAERPLTYAFIQKQIVNISKGDIARMYNQYGWSW